jgi:hypothetical protein
MMDDDRDLARLFDELRRSDEASAPSFTHVLGRPGARAPSRSQPLRFAAVAMVLAVVALGVALLRPHPHGTASTEIPMSLAQWKSPTDWLLETPGKEILGELPGPPEPVVSNLKSEGANPVPIKTSRPSSSLSR